MLLKAAVCLLFGIQLAIANVEKTIFLGPQTINIPLQPPTLDDLHIDVLTPDNGTLRTRIHAGLPVSAANYGKEARQWNATWLLLDNLIPGTRYEARVSWAGTPTAFSVETHELPLVWATPELISSLYEYSMARQPTDEEEEQKPKVHRASKDEKTGEREASVLFLQILASADYVTTDKALMQSVPPVFVDITLDPFLFNLVPQSLVPILTYILAVGAGTFFLSLGLVAWIRGYAAHSPATGKEKEKKQQ